MANKTEKFLKSVLIRLVLILFSFLHYGISLSLLIQGKTISEETMTMFIIMSSISFISLFLLTMIPFMKSINNNCPN